MDNFNLYAQFYDLLNKDKDYQQEVDYIDSLLKQQSISGNEILDLGCGTGIHAALMTEKGYIVDGVDLSEEMIARATENYSDNPGLTFKQGDMRNYRSGKEYPAVTSLFHVMSYQNSNEDLTNAFRTAHANLKYGGLFVFDFWYGPGVLTDLPEKREKTFSNEKIAVVRKAVPEMHIDRNVVDVNYEIQITDLDSQHVETFHEKHSMRYLFQPEVLFFLKEAGFKLLGFYHWLTLDTPTSDTWNAVAIAKKIR